MTDGTDPFDRIVAPAPNGAAPPEPRISARDKLMAIGTAATLWRSPDGDAFASLELDGHQEHHSINSRAFKDWLKARYAERWPAFIENQRHPGSPGRKGMDEAVDALETRARLEGETHEPAVRSVRVGERIYIDLGDTAWRAIEVTARGWRVVDRSPVPILRSRKAKPLPMPTSPGNVQLLAELFALVRLDDDGASDEQDLRLVASWLLSALWPVGPYPILAVSGEQGSGKSTFTRAMRRLTDPAGADILSPPKDERDLAAMARHNRVVCFDNLSSVPSELADAICRLATGGEIGGRALFSDHDSASFEACRPVVLNGIPDLATRGDLASRAVHIGLPVLASSDDESAFWRRFDELAPSILGGLLDGMARALRDLAATPVPQGIRMADFVKVAAAAAPAWGWSADEIAEHMKDNAKNQIATLIDADPIAEAALSLVEQEGGFSGTASTLLGRLAVIAGEAATRSTGWPRTAHQLSSRLMRAAPALRANGVSFERAKVNHERLIKLVRTGTQGR